MMTMECHRNSDVPYFAFPIRRESGTSQFSTSNHLQERPLMLNVQAAEILRLADGERSLNEIMDYFERRYPHVEPSLLREKILQVLDAMTRTELIWWRDKPVRLHAIEPPRTIFWEITSLCNLKCLHCVVSAGKRNSDELSVDRCFELIREMAGFGVQNIAFSGGEPLMHPEFKNLAEAVAASGMSIQVATNGTLVTREIAQWLRDLRADVQVSLDGSTSLIHDKMRPGNRAFEKAVRGIRHLLGAGHVLTVGSVVSKNNRHDIKNIITLCENLGVQNFRLIPFVPKGRGGTFAGMEITASEMKAITEMLISERKRRKINIIPLEFEKMVQGTACVQPASPGQSLGCGGARAYGTITPAGELLPCHFFEGVRADSVAGHAFADVWIQSRFLNYFRSLTVHDLHGACRDCRWLSACAGSCRAINFAKGDVFGANKGCWIAEEIENDGVAATA
ncbi:PqqD family peptide modification chaperone [bacterium]|nr:PqqD family peptide modification chaperone [bacterium]